MRAAWYTRGTRKKDPFLIENVFYLRRAERLSARRKRSGDQLERINEKHDNTKEIKGSRGALTREADMLTQTARIIT